MAETAWADGHRTLYHWQRFDEERLANTLANRAIYCSSPSAFNDPWDCKPHFNTDILSDPIEYEKHVQWAVGALRRTKNLPEAELDGVRQRLQTDRALMEQSIDGMPTGLASDIDRRYRVYCLGPDVSNLLMWSHYADNHKGRR